MQSVKQRWLTIYAWILAGIDILIIVAYIVIHNSSLNSVNYTTWGITPLILGIACVHLMYVAVFFRFVSKKSEPVATFISVTLFLFLFAALIETSQYNNLAIRIGYAFLVFSTAVTGLFVPAATVVATWIFFLYTYFSVLNAPGLGISIRFELVMNIIVSISAFFGWLFFKRFYIKKKDKETIALSRLLEQEQFKSNVMLESISDGVMVVSTSGIVQVVNQSAATILGRTKNEATRTKYSDLLLGVSEEGGTPQTPSDIVQAALTSKEPAHGVVLLQTKNKRTLFVDIMASPIFETIETKVSDEIVETTKSMVGVIAIIRDVDEQKRQEQQRSEFISTASHEMRTPVASLQGFLELALTPKIKSDPERSFQYVEKAYKTAKHLGDLFTDLLVVSQHDQNSTVVHLEPVDVNALLQDILKQNENSAQAKNLIVTLKNNSSNPDLLLVAADKQKLAEVLQNLVQNAIKYTDAGSITLSAEEKAETVEIGVSDTGIGIAQEDIPNLFKKFFRVDNSKTRTIGGTGLGLYIAKILTESMDGKIWVESTIGKGSSFYIELNKKRGPTITSTNHKQNAL